MKNVLKFLGVIALAAVIGFTVSCKHDDDGGGGSFDSALEGTWKGEGNNGTLKISADKWEGSPENTSDAARVAMIVEEARKAVKQMADVPGGEGSLDFSNGKLSMKASVSGTPITEGDEGGILEYKIASGTLTIKLINDGVVETEIAFEGVKQ